MADFSEQLERGRAVLPDLLGSFGAAVFGQAALVVSGVAVARMLGPEKRGYLALFVLLTTGVFLLGGLGLPSAVSYHTARDPMQARRLIAQLALPVAVQILALALIQGSILLIVLSHGSTALHVAAAASVAATPACLVLDYGLAALQGQRRFKAFNVLRSVPVGLYAVGSISLFLLNQGGLVSVALVWMGGYIGAALATAWTWLRRAPDGRGTADSPSRSELLRFGLKGLIGSASPLETFRIDQAIVGIFLSPAALGLYVVSVAFTNIPRFIGMSVGVIAYPHVASQNHRNEAIRALWLFLAIGSVVSLGAAALLSALVDRLIPLFFGSGFTQAAGASRYLLVGAAFLAARRILADGTRGLGYPTIGSLAEMASWLWLLPALLLLAPRAGIIGVSIAWASASLFSLAIGLIASLTLLRGGEPSGRFVQVLEGTPGRVVASN